MARRSAADWTILASQAVTCLLLWLWGLRGTSGVDLPVTLALLATGAVMLELAALQLPAAGFVSAAFVCYLPACLVPELGRGWGFVLVAVALGLRTLTRGHPDPYWRAREGLLDGLAVLAAVAGAEAASRLISPWWPEGAPLWARSLVALEIYLPAALLLPRGLRAAVPGADQEAWDRAQSRLAPLLVAIGFSAVAAAYLSALGGLHVLWLAPVVAALYRLGGQGLLEVEPGVLRQAQAQLAESRQAQDRQARELDLARKDLRRKLEEYILLEELSGALTGSRDVRQCLDTARDVVGRLVECDSVVFFLDQEGLLAPVSYRSPDAERLAEAGLLKLQEPLVEKAWREDRTVAGPEPQAQRLFPEEDCSLAIPLRGASGVLYVGRRTGSDFAAEERHLLGLVAHQTGAALGSVGAYEALSRSARSLEQAHQELRTWVGQLDGLLESAQTLARSLEPRVLMDQVQAALAHLVEHDSHVLFLDRPELIRTWRDGTAGIDLEKVRPLLEAVTGSGRPLLIEDLDTSRFEPLVEGEKSALVVPLTATEGVMGAIAVGSRRTGAFTRQHHDLVSVLGYQVALAVANALRHEETVEAYRRLQESEAQLVHSSRLSAVGELAAGVAHELNTPLGSILMAVESAQMSLESAPETVEGKLKLATTAAVRARDIVGKLLYYVRDARAGRKPTDLGTVVADTLELSGYRLRREEVEVEVELEAGFPLVHCNEHEIQQVISNLVLNARDAVLSCPTEYPGRIGVRLYRREDQAVLEVRDNGPGIAPEHAARIFDPFFSTKPLGQGTGLGLSVSRQIVDAHGGTLEFSSSPEGTTFFLRLPLEAQLRG